MPQSNGGRKEVAARTTGSSMHGCIAYTLGNPRRYIMRFRKHMSGAAAHLIETRRAQGEAYLADCRIHGEVVESSALQEISYARSETVYTSEPPD